jgi:surface polysaccharide O-acyltransferase-like enzyme
MSLIFGLIIFPELWQAGLPRILLEFTGFSVLSGLGTGPVIVIDWFIAAIVSLYLLFPLLSKIIRQYGLWSLAGFCLMSWGLRSVIISSGILPEYRLWMWFPLCNAFEFCLGIYIVQTGWYPKKANTSPIIRELSDLSYYVFIFHTLIIFAFGEYLYPFPKPLAAFDLALASNKVPIAATIFYFQVMITILVVSWITMKIDTRFRSWILQRDAIRNFLNAGNG